MSITEREILNEFESIRKCLDLVVSRADDVKKCFEDVKKIWFIGCGSSYCLAKSAASMFTLRCNIPSFAAAAGDMMLHAQRYSRAVEGSMVCVISRSGMTSEVLSIFNTASKWPDVRTMVLCANEESKLNGLCDFTVCMPWAFDESVCQTRTIGSFYGTIAMLCAILSDDEQLKDELFTLCGMENELNESILPLAKKTAQYDWNDVVVLGDAETSGLMEEGALAFKEISCIISNFYNLLDVRHGPLVMINRKTFVFALIENNGINEQKLIRDIHAKTDTVLTAGPFDGGVCHYRISSLKDPISYSLAALYIMQNIALQKAYILGTNPDEPHGLNAWIAL